MINRGSVYIYLKAVNVFNIEFFGVKDCGFRYPISGTRI